MHEVTLLVMLTDMQSSFQQLKFVGENYKTIGNSSICVDFSQDDRKCTLHLESEYENGITTSPSVTTPEGSGTTTTTTNDNSPYQNLVVDPFLKITYDGEWPGVSNNTCGCNIGDIIWFSVKSKLPLIFFYILFVPEIIRFVECLYFVILRQYRRWRFGAILLVSAIEIVDAVFHSFFLLICADKFTALQHISFGFLTIFAIGPLKVLNSITGYEILPDYKGGRRDTTLITGKDIPDGTFKSFKQQSTRSISRSIATDDDLGSPRWAIATSVIAYGMHLGAMGLLIYSFTITLDLQESQNRLIFGLTIAYIMWYGVKHLINHIDNDRQYLDQEDKILLNNTVPEKQISTNLSELRRLFRSIRDNSTETKPLDETDNSTGEPKTMELDRKADMFNIYLIASMARMCVFGIVFYTVDTKGNDNEFPYSYRKNTDVQFDEDFVQFITESIYNCLYLQLAAAFLTKVFSQLAVRTKLQNACFSIALLMSTILSFVAFSFLDVHVNINYTNGQYTSEFIIGTTYKRWDALTDVGTQFEIFLMYALKNRTN